MTGVLGMGTIGALLFWSGSADAQESLGGSCSSCVCADARVFDVSSAECPARDSNFDMNFLRVCVRLCEGNGAAAPSATVEAYFRLVEQVQADQGAGQHVANTDFDEEFAPKPRFDPRPCGEALAAIETTVQSFAHEAEQEGLIFSAKDALGVARTLGRAGRSEKSWVDALKGVLDLQKRVRAWSEDLDAYTACSRQTSCDALGLLKRVNKDLRAFLREVGFASKEAIARVERASRFLEDYGRRLQAAQEANTQRALACVGAPP